MLFPPGVEPDTEFVELISPMEETVKKSLDPTEVLHQVEDHPTIVHNFSHALTIGE